MMEHNKPLIRMIILGTVIMVMLIVYFFGVNFNSDECSMSRFNPSNVTGGTYLFGKCYVPYYGVYTSTEKCGFLGISCRDVQPYTIMYSGTLCFKLKTGEPC